MEASKWLDIQLLISAEEMEQLFSHLQNSIGNFQIFQVGRVLPPGQGEEKHFLEKYQRYISALKNGNLPDEEDYRPLFSSAWTVSPEVISIQKFPDNRELLRLTKPAVQLQPHAMIYSEQDGKFYSMVYGRDSILWGLQFSYPQLYLHPQTKDVMKVDDSPNFPNTTLFRHIQRWVRHQTIPTPIQGVNMQLNLPVRLGKECLTWINQHPQLKNHNLSIRI